MQEQKKRAIIASTELFKGLPDDQIRIISNLTVEKKFSRGETIFFEGDEAKGFYIVGDGQVKIFKMNALGKEHILHIFGPGEPLVKYLSFTPSPFLQVQRPSQKAVLSIFSAVILSISSRHTHLCRLICWRYYQ